MSKGRRHGKQLPAPPARTRVLLALVVVLLVATLVLISCGDDADTTTTAVSTDTTADGATGTTSGDASSDTSTPAPPAGDQLFATLCAGCHGNDGKSGFAEPVVGAETDDIREAVTQGKGDMAGFGDKLSTEEIDAIVEYVGSLQ